MNSFVDPRIPCAAVAQTSEARITARVDDLAELHALCRDGRLYDVERWIQAGRPLQLSEVTPKGRVTSALQIGLETGNQALVLLLLSNGYDPNAEFQCPLDLALRSRRFDLVDLLLNWGTDPVRVNLSGLFDTYDSGLYARFRDFGVDLATGHELAEALAYHTSNKPLLGFVKRHRLIDEKLQTELDIALAHHAGEGNEKGVQLCLWAGGNPHVPVPNLRFRVNSSSDVEDADAANSFEGFSAVHEACQHGNVEILKRLRPDPTLDDFEELWRVASSPEVIELLARHGLPTNVGSVIQHHLWWATFTEGWRWVATLKRLFEVGVRWKHSTPDDIGSLRRSLLKTSNGTFVDLMKVLATDDYCSSQILSELARTPSMRDRMRKVGFIQSSDDQHRFNPIRPTGSREVVKRFGVEVRQRKRPKQAPRFVQLARRTPNGERIQLNRDELFDRVWAEPVAIVAKVLGLSGTGLKKVCRRLGVPVPPRGYWAKLKAGKKVRRPTLPANV